MKAAVIGAGSWGTTLAHVAAENNIRTSLWVRRQKLANEIREIGKIENTYLSKNIIKNTYFY